MIQTKPKIILTNASVEHNYVRSKYYYRLPPLGLGYIAAVLERNGFSVQIIDRAISRDEIEDDIVDLVEEIIRMHPDVLGFHAVTETFKIVMRILKMVKEKVPAVITILGGPHVYGLAVRGMDYPWLDYSFLGEAEESFLQLLRCNFDSSQFANISGLIYRDNGEVKVNSMALVENLDSLSIPARHLFPRAENYRPSIITYKRLPATGIITSRGCPYKCIFCHSGSGKFKLRFHSPVYVLEEIKYLKKDFGINELIFFDDTFLINQERALEICEAILKENLDLSWSCSARAVSLDKDLLRLMKKAGCWQVQIGAESGNQKILDTIKKDITLEQISESSRQIEDAGLEVKAYFILGHPQETEQTIDDTIRFISRLPAHYASINLMTVFPGTELWERAEEFGTIDKEKLEDITCLSDRPLFIPFGLTEKFLINKLKEAYVKFYLNPKTIMRNIKTISSAEDIKKLFTAALVLLKIACFRLAGKTKVNVN